MSESFYKGLDDVTLQRGLRRARRSYLRNIRGGWMSLAERDLNIANRIQTEVDRRNRVQEEAESEFYDEWGNYIGPPRPAAAPRWRSKEFWFSWR